MVNIVIPIKAALKPLKQTPIMIAIKDKLTNGMSFLFFRFKRKNSMMMNAEEIKRPYMTWLQVVILFPVDPSQVKGCMIKIKTTDKTDIMMIDNIKVLYRFLLSVKSK